MDNKNEKTFSDLFENINNDSDDNLKEEKITFDSLSNIVDDNVDVSNISFGDINSIAEEDYSDDFNSSEEVSFNQINSNVFEDDDNRKFADKNMLVDDKLDTFGNIFNEVDDSIDKNDVIIENDIDINDSDTEEDVADKVVQENINDLDNIFVSNGEAELVDEKVEINPFMDVTNKLDEVVDNSEVVQENINNLDNIFMSNGEAELVDEKVEINPFMDVTNNLDEVVDDSEVVQENIKEPKNIFMNDSNIENTTEVNNPFVGDVSVENNSDIGVTDKNEDNIVMKDEVEKVTNNEFSSPFFDSDNFDDTNNNSLFSNSISLGEVDVTNNNVNKLNLSNTKHFDVKIVPKKEPISKFIIGVISYSFFIWLLLIGITLLVYVLDIKIRAAKGDYSAPTFNAYVVLTGSMLPEIHVNDVVITKRTNAEELEVGDIITFASADSRFLGTVITHRIIKKNQDKEGNITFQTQGDNNNVADNALVPEANIYGKVILKIPKLGYLQEFLATDGGWIVVILIPCLAVISYDIVKIAKGIKKKKNNGVNINNNINIKK